MVQDKKRVLIVDDTMVDRMILKSILEADFRVLEADSGNRAFVGSVHASYRWV